MSEFNPDELPAEAFEPEIDLDAKPESTDNGSDENFDTKIAPLEEIDNGSN